MNLIPANKSHLPCIMEIIHDAQQYLATQNIDQWQDGYPDESVMLADIEHYESYVVKNEGEILATAMFTTRLEPTYSIIEGNWLTEKDSTYGVIHRMAIKSEYRKHGIAQYIFDEFENQLIENSIKSMRIDTHKDNIGIQKLLKKRGYTYCGIIYVANGSKRLAFERCFY